MDFKLYNGLKSRVDAAVTEHTTAEHVGSGAVKVFATPAMIGLMEAAALKAVAMHLPKEYTTVGTRVEVSHQAATPIGMRVYAIAELIRIHGSRLNFRVEAYDEKERIGEGIHERYIINVARFMEKTTAKA